MCGLDHCRLSDPYGEVQVTICQRACREVVRVRPDDLTVEFKVVSASSPSVVSLRSKERALHPTTGSEATIVWLGAVYYASRANTDVVFMTEDDTPPLTDASEVSRLVKLAHAIPSAWQESPRRSIGEELADLLLTLGENRVERVSRGMTAAWDDFYWLPKVHLLTASSLNVGVRGDERRHAGIGLTILDTVQIGAPTIYEQLLLHEVLRAVDYYAPLDGEKATRF